jgi:hypothetical protein
MVMKLKACHPSHCPKNLFQVLFLFLMLALLVSACQTAPGATPTITQPGTFPVDPLFNEYYRDNGGENLLGPVISTLFEQEGLKCQYTVGALMCLDPEATGAARYRLASLGVRIGIHEDPPAATAQPEGSQMVDGYSIYPGFVKLISSLHGMDGVGKPLSSPRYNYAQQRVEQYFENAAFYYRFDDPSGKVSLLPYGWYYCGRTCHYELSENRAFNPVIQPLDTPFAPALEQMGGLRVFGQPLTQPYTARDGSLEQVYENIVAYASKDNPGVVHLRPLARQLEMISVLPGPKKYGPKDNMVFYPTAGELGYHVPVVFDGFIALHGGLDFSGMPIADVMYYQKDVPRQCFEGYCLDYHAAAADSLRVRMVPLGVQYLSRFAPANAVPTSMPKIKLTLTASEQAPQITSQEKQIINIMATDSDTQNLAVNVATMITLTLPDATRSTLSVSPTDSSGRTSVTIPAMPSLPNGSMVVYQVCVDEPGSAGPCVNGSYLIWNNK